MVSLLAPDQRRKARSFVVDAGLLLPWMLVWQFTHPRARMTARLVAVPDPRTLPGTVPRWLVGSWHSWHRYGGRWRRRAALVVPCGLWQIAQFSWTGGWFRT